MLTLLLFALSLNVPAAAQGQASRPFTPRPIAVEVGTAATDRDSLLDLLLAAPDDDATTIERELADSVADRPWLRLVGEEGEAAVAVSRCRRTISTRSRSKDGRRVTITFRYIATAGIAIRGERESIEADTLVSHSYEEGASRQSPTRSQDRDAFRQVGRELAKKAREWILPRIGVLRPDGPDAGFLHRPRFRLLFRGDGLEVTEVTPGSPADRAGLQVGDRIRRIDGESGTTQMDERVRTWRLEAPGTRVVLEVERNRQRQMIAVALQAPPGRGEPRQAPTPAAEQATADPARRASIPRASAPGSSARGRPSSG